MSDRKAKTKTGELLFPDVSAKKLNNYLKQISGKDYTVKDFRTYLGTKLAYKELYQYSGKVLDKAKKMKIIKDVTEQVSKVLRNTPAMAMKSYIDPLVWDIIGGLK